MSHFQFSAIKVIEFLFLFVHKVLSIILNAFKHHYNFFLTYASCPYFLSDYVNET